jgi:hypothetical protein
VSEIPTCLSPAYSMAGFHVVGGMKSAEETPVCPVLAGGTVGDVGLLAPGKGWPFVVPYVLNRIWIAALRFVPRSISPRLTAAVFRRSWPAGS